MGRRRRGMCLRIFIRESSGWVSRGGVGTGGQADVDMFGGMFVGTRNPWLSCLLTRTTSA